MWDRNFSSGRFSTRLLEHVIMQWPTEDAVSALLNDQPNLGAWLPTLGVMALAMTPLALILAGTPGAVLTSAFFIFVWLASLIWVFARHGSLGSARVLPSAAMVVSWPVIGILFVSLW
jgi:hypothetical protein